MINGIDVSRYQANIDWQSVAASGIKFAIIRCGYANSDGSITEDKMFRQNMTNAIAAGIQCGVYVFSYVETPTTAAVAATNVLKMVKPYKLLYPLCWDYEYSAQYAPYGREKNTEICKAALYVWERAGYYAMLYTYKSFANSYLNMSDLKNYDFWLAHYTKDGLNTPSSYSGPYGIWQYSSVGTVNGISSRVDLNVSYKDYATIISNAHLNGVSGGDIRPSTDTNSALYDIDINGVSKGDMNTIKELCEELNLAYKISEVE